MSEMIDRKFPFYIYLQFGYPLSVSRICTSSCLITLDYS